MADGIKIDDLEVQADFATNGLRFTFLSGGLQSRPVYVGGDDDVPVASGRDRGQWRAAYRDVALHGIVVGEGATAELQRVSFRQRTAALLAVMQPSSLVTLVVHPPNFGLSAGETATLANVRPIRIDGPPPDSLWYEGWTPTLHLRALSPTWTLSGGPSYLVTPAGDPMFTPAGDRLYVEV